MKRTGMIDLSEGHSIIFEETDYTAYLAHVDSVCDMFNNIFRQDGSPIRFSSKRLHKQIETGDFADRSGLISKFIDDQRRGQLSDGMLHPPQIVTTGEIISTLRRDLQNSVAVIGAMQCGKTGTSNGCEFVAVILFLLTGQPYYTISLLTSRKAHFAQARDERAMFDALYDNVDIMLLDETGETIKEISFENYMKLSITLEKYVLKVMSKAKNLKPEWEADVDRLSDDTKVTPASVAATVHPRTANRSRIGVVRDLCKVAKEQNFNVVFKIDEVHWGTGSEIQNHGTRDERGSTFARFLSEVRDELINQEGHLFIGLSATPYQIAFLDNINKVYHRLGKGYVGPNFFNGKPLDPSVELILPDVRSIISEAERAGGKGQDIIGLSFSRYRMPNSFQKWVEKLERQGVIYGKDWDGYRDNFRKQTKSIIEQTLLKDYGPGEHAQAVCLRGVNSNGEMRSFVSDLKLDPKIHVEFYDGETASKGSSIKRFIQANASGKKHILIVVTGAARMADAFPTSLDGHALRWAFLDLTHKSTTQAALLQGLYGRACGYGKLFNGLPPVVIVSEENYDLLNQFHDEKGGVIMHAIGSTVRVGAGRGRAMMQLPIMKQMTGVSTDPTVMKVFEKLQDQVDQIVPFDRMNLQGRKNIPVDIWAAMDMSDMDYIESNSSKLFPELLDSVKLLRPRIGMTKSQKKKDTHYRMGDATGEYDKTLGYVGLRAVSASDIKSGGGGDVTLRDARRNLIDARTLVSANEIVPQIFVYRNEALNKWEVRGILLRLTGEARERRSATSVLPLLDGFHGHLVSGDQLEEVRGANDKLNARRIAKGKTPLIHRGEEMAVEDK